MKKFITVLAAMLLSTSAVAEIAVVVNPANASAIDAAAASRIFLGKMKSFGDGSQAEPVAQAAGSAVTEEFNDKVLKKSASQLKAYWAKLVFTGKGTPPKELSSDAEVIAAVAANPNMIGYVSASAVDGSVKVVGTF